MSAEQNGVEIAPAKGKLGVLLVGLGAVSTTFIAGVEAIKRGLADPVGSLTQMGAIRLGRRTENRNPLIKDLVPLASLEDIVFGAWDIFPDSAYEAALTAGVLEKELLAQLKPQLQKIKPMKAVFDQHYVKRLNGTNVKEGANKFELAQQLIEDMAEFKRKNKCSRLVIVWAASTEIFLKQHAVHKTLKSFEQAMRDNHKAIAPSMVYAYAALKSGVPFANGAPNLTVDIPAMTELANANGVPVCGKDFKTGQTLMKISVEAHQTRTIRSSPFLVLKLRMSCRSCSASSRLVLPDLTFFPSSRFTYCWSNAAGIGLMALRKSAIGSRCSCRSSTPALTAAV